MTFVENGNDIEIVKYNNNKEPSLAENLPKNEKQKSGRESILKISMKSSLRFDINLMNRDIENGNLSKSNEYQYDLSNLDSIKNLFEVITEIIIKQEADILESITGCQEPNFYDIYGKMPEGDKIHMFKCREFSSCGMRYFCPVSSREFSMKIQSVSEEEEKNDNVDEEEFGNPLITINKNCRCPFLCCIRPCMNVILVNGGIQIGIIKQSFSILDPIFTIYDKNETPIYYLEADCCQCGFLCRNNFMGKTDDAHFFIYNYNEKGNPVGDICKKAAKSMFSIADDYSVVLPTKASFEDKLLLMIAGIMIDYQYFEMNTDSK